jgi:hypothetical protein
MIMMMMNMIRRRSNNSRNSRYRQVTQTRKELCVMPTLLQTNSVSFPLMHCGGMKYLEKYIEFQGLYVTDFFYQSHFYKERYTVIYVTKPWRPLIHE